jgi:hypothetical protein
VALPELGASEVLVRTHAVGVNPLDLRVKSSFFSLWCFCESVCLCCCMLDDLCMCTLVCVCVWAIVGHMGDVSFSFWEAVQVSASMLASALLLHVSYLLSSFSSRSYTIDQ